MPNAETRAAWEYHDGTKHSPESIRRSRHYLDWANQPRPYKLYATLEGLALPRNLASSQAPVLEAISSFEVARDRPRAPGLSTLTTVLQHSAGITKHLRYPGGLMPFRAASCTGALYHIELYIICGQRPDLDAGVYQFGVHDLALRRLRAGDFRGALTRAAGGEQAVTDAPAVVVCTSTFWRNSWKYESRTYRHGFWDSGTILANMLAMAAAHDLPARVIAGFVDHEVNRLVDVDGQREAALTLVPLGFDPATRPGSSPTVEELGLKTVALSPTEVDYPAIRAMHAASSLHSPAEVARWRDAAPRAGRRSAGISTAEQGEPSTPPGGLIPLEPLALAGVPSEPIESVIHRRGSSRRFEQAPISFESLCTMLDRTTGGIPADFLGPPAMSLNDVYLIVNAVDGLQSGAYVYHPDRHALEMLKAGSFREQAGYLALTQRLAADAAVNIYFLADLRPVLSALGNRGYRAAQLEASIRAGKLYLAAYALGLGATGLTFFDDEVTAFFSPHAQGKSVMFLIALGRPFRRPTT